MNRSVEDDNRASGAKRKVRKFSRREFWRYVGAMLAGPVFGRGGSVLFGLTDKKSKTKKRMRMRRVQKDIDLREVCYFICLFCTLPFFHCLSNHSVSFFLSPHSLESHSPDSRSLRSILSARTNVQRRR